jgi:hypothetical protein
MPERIRDPRQLPVQLNVKIPFDFREHLYQISKRQGVSMTSLVVDALRKEYLPDPKDETRDAGATS